MIKFSGVALIHSISPILQVSANFQKRELILDASWEKDGKRYPNFILVEFTGDKMAQLDALKPGMMVSVEGMLHGREYNQRIYNTIRGISATQYQPNVQPNAQSQAPQPAPMPSAAPQPAPMPSAAPQPAPMPSAAPQPAPYPQQPYGQAPTPGVADLPFTR